MRKAALLFLAVLCVSAGGLYVYVKNLESQIQPAAGVASGGQIALVREANAPDIGGTFTLTNDKNETVTEKSLVGSKFHLLFFGFSHCPDVCPGMLQTMAGVFEKLTPDEQAKLQMVFVSVDPDRDTAAKLGEYVRGFNPSFVGWRGDKAQIDAMTSNYLAYYAKKPDDKAPDGYTMDHSAMLYVMGPDGKYVMHMRNSDSATEIQERLQKLLK